MLPQKFPFAFLDLEAGEEGARVLLTAGSWISRGRPLAQSLALEILAQTALVELVHPASSQGGEEKEKPAGKTGGQPAIAGFDSVEYSEAWALRPPLACEELVAKTHLLGRFGPMLKVSGTLKRDGETLVEATLLLVSP